MFPLIWFTPSDTQLLWMGNFSLWLQHRFSLLLYLKRWIPEWTKKEKGDETSEKLENWLLAHWWKYQPLDTRWHKGKSENRSQKEKSSIYTGIYLWNCGVHAILIHLKLGGRRKKDNDEGLPTFTTPPSHEGIAQKTTTPLWRGFCSFSSTHSERVHFSSTSWKKKNPFSKSRSTRRSSLSKSTGKETEQVKERKRDTVNGQSS